MSHWNCRIIYHDKDEHPWYGVHEVFYNDDESINAYTVDAMDLTGETKDELVAYAELVMKDILKEIPILVESEIVCVDDEPYEYEGKSYTTYDELIAVIKSDEPEE